MTGADAGTGQSWAHAAALAAAAAPLIAATAASPPAASLSTVRDTVGSEATRPNTRGCARSPAMSARQSPPNTSAPARSRTTLPGSCTAVSGRHRPSARDNPRSNPVARAACTNNTPPADNANGSVPATTPGSGRPPTRRPRLPGPRTFGLPFTYGVPLLAADPGLSASPVSLPGQALPCITGPSDPACHPTR